MDISQFKNNKVVRAAYFTVLLLICALIISIPYLTKGDLKIGVVEIKENSLDAILIGFFLIVGFFIYRSYAKEIAIQSGEIESLSRRKGEAEDRLAEAFRYIGAINIQIQEIKSIFSAFEKYPEDNEDFKQILRYSAYKALSMINVDWVLIRIVEISTLRTLREFSATRGGAVLLKHNISNWELIEVEPIDGYTVVRSNQKNLNVKAFCIIPLKNITEDQKIFITAVVSQIEMLFIIFTSEYYKGIKNNGK